MAKTKTADHSPMFEKIKGWYPKRWDVGRVKEAVVKGWLTANEYKEITGDEYEG